MFRTAVAVALLTAAGAAAQPLPAFFPEEQPPRPSLRLEADSRANVVVRWNDAALAAIRAEKTPPPVAARNLAVLHVAVYDAVTAVRPTHKPFLVTSTAPAGASPEAAAVSAAHRVLAALYPGHRDFFDALFADTLAGVPADAARSGSTVGREVAGKVLDIRSRDADGFARTEYTPRGGVGRWLPTPDRYADPLLPGWAAVRPFALPELAAFRPPPPPAVGSKEFAASYHGVKLLGSATSTVRTRDQTEIARFWADGEGTVTPPGHWNRIAASLAAGEKASTADAARLFALLNVAMADAAIICWECKYHFDLWRPVTAIRSAGPLNDPALLADPNWSPLLPTPPFPSYTSGHSSFSGAAAAALAAHFGSDEFRFTSTSDGLPGVTRSFRSFSAAAKEAGASRIYGGIHYDFDNEAGLACGREIGEYVARHFFKPANVSLKPGR